MCVETRWGSPKQRDEGRENRGPRKKKLAQNRENNRQKKGITALWSASARGHRKKTGDSKKGFEGNRQGIDFKKKLTVKGIE